MAGARRDPKVFATLSASENINGTILISKNTGKDTNICLSPWERVTEVNWPVKVERLKPAFDREISLFPSVIHCFDSSPAPVVWLINSFNYILYVTYNL